MPYPGGFATLSGVRADLGKGWGYWNDSQHTLASPQAIAADARTKFTVDGLGATTVTDYLETMTSGIFANSTIQPYEAGETYELRVDFTATPNAVQQNEYITLELDIGTVIVEKRLALQKGAGSAHKFSETIPIFCGANFVANGGELYITPTVGVDVYAKAIKIERSYKP